MKYIILIIILFLSCVRFKVDELSSNILFNIPIGNDIKSLQFRTINNLPINLPNTLFYANDKIYVPNLEQGTVKIFNKSGDLEIIIGSNLELPKDKKITIIDFPLSQAVKVIPGHSGDYYIQNRLSSVDIKKDQNLNNVVPVEKEIPNSSYIIHLKESGDLIGSIGTQGLKSSPFGYIYHMSVDNNSNLFVYHLFGYFKFITWIDPKGKLLQEIQENELSNIINEVNSKVEIEDIVPFSNSDNFLVSVAYRNKKVNKGIKYRFKYRKIFKFNRLNISAGKIMVKITDPKEALFWTAPNEGFYVYQNEGKINTIRIQVYNKEGNHINNKRLTLTGSRFNWRQIYSNFKYEILTIYSNGKSISLYNWQ